MPSSPALIASRIIISGCMLRMWFRNDMNASRPSRPTTMYDALGCHGIPSAGVCVFTTLRWVCASRRATTSSIGSKRASSHGEIAQSELPIVPLGSRISATIACIQVVPHFGGVHTKTSSGRAAKRFQRRLSDTTLRYSRSMGRSTASPPVDPSCCCISSAPRVRVPGSHGAGSATGRPRVRARRCSDRSSQAPGARGRNATRQSRRPRRRDHLRARSARWW